MAPPLTAADEVDAALVHDGYAVVDAAQVESLMGVVPGVGERAFAHWAATWNHLPPDNYLRDGGRYRQRRHGSFVDRRRARRARRRIARTGSRWNTTRCTAASSAGSSRSTAAWSPSRCGSACC